MPIMPFKPGEIITGIRNPLIERIGFNNYSIKGTYRKLATYKVEGISRLLPYARGLLKKKFIVYYDSNLIGTDIKDYDMGPSIDIILLKDYKEGVYEKGYNLNIHDTKSFKSTGQRIIDFNKLPIYMQKRHFEREIIKGLTSSHIRIWGKDLIDKWEFNKRCQLNIFSDDLHKIYATLNVMDKACRNCGLPLDRANVKHIDLTTTLLYNVKYGIRYIYKDLEGKDLDTSSFVIFPVLYICGECKDLIVLYSINPTIFNFRHISLGPAVDHGIK